MNSGNKKTILIIKHKTAIAKHGKLNGRSRSSPRQYSTQTRHSGVGGSVVGICLDTSRTASRNLVFGQLAGGHALNEGFVEVDLILRHVETLVDLLGNWLDLRSQFHFNLVEVIAVILCDQVDGDSKMSEPSRPTDAMQVSLSHTWKVKVNDNIDRLDVNTSSEQISTD